MRIEPFEMGGFLSMAYVIGADGADEGVVIDPGEAPGRLIDWLRGESLTVAAILNTHGHGDHVAGNAALKAAFPDAPILIGEADAGMLTDPVANLSALFGMPWQSPPADGVLADGQRLDLAGLTIECRHVPGHSPGQMVFYVPHEGACFCGDTVFSGSIGRSDFPGGDGEVLIEAIRRQILSLPPRTRLYPGHGPPTTVAEEAAGNPFLS
jgi:glyoxylase-like metal-dependent hydrolase (beta-lactamase superfamily II)